MATVNTADLFTTTEAARFLGMKTETVQKYCLNAEIGGSPAISAMRFGRSFMIPKKVAREFKKNRKGPGRPTN